jgi:hypothetical protein
MIKNQLASARSLTPQLAFAAARRKKMSSLQMLRLANEISENTNVVVNSVDLSKRGCLTASITITPHSGGNAKTYEYQHLTGHKSVQYFNSLEVPSFYVENLGGAENIMGNPDRQEISILRNEQGDVLVFGSEVGFQSNTQTYFSNIHRFLMNDNTRSAFYRVQDYFNVISRQVSAFIDCMEKRETREKTPSGITF